MAIHMPKYPNMCISLLRYQSFDQWPSTEEIDKEAFVDAGFFYTGFNDHVRCFDCGIGLRNWQNEDNPDAEHARWSPKCKFIIDRKGIDFVESIQKAVKQEEVKAILDQSKVVFSFSANELSNIGSITEGDIDIMSCGRVPTKAEKKNPLLTDAAQAVLSLGYLPKLVSSAVTSILQENGWRALNAENILLGIRSLIANEKLTENGAKGKSTENGVQPVTFERKVAKTEHKTKSRDSYQRMIKENNEMREQLTCKICCEDSVSVAFLPCGHLSCCWLCAPSLKLCPLCRAEMSLSSLTMKASDLVFRCVKPYCYYLPDYFPDLTIDMDKETEERMLQYLGESPLQRANLWDSIASIKKTPNLNPKLVSAIENFEGVLLQGFDLKVLPETDQLLYELFCFIYVSEGQTDGTRTLFRVFDDITNISKQYTNISSGSAAEGLRIAKGDYDVMTVLNLITVDNKVFPSIGEKPMLWYDASCSNPGFVKIEIAEGPYKEEILSNWGVYHENRPLLSNSKFKNYFQRNYRINDTKIHGPCISSLREHDGVDHLFCLKCKTRLDLVKTWVSRAKSHDGLDDTIIARVANKDVLLAPVGDNFSSESVYPFQWRLSLSLLEKELVHSWSHLQFLCYYIIKYLIKRMTKDIPAKIICSFFIKNALFWLGEETHESFWRECHIFECIDVVMNRLSWWYKQGYCPHYFVPENNLFKGIESCYLPIAADLTSKWSLMVKNCTNIELGFTSVEFLYFERYLTEDTYFQEKMNAILLNMKFLRNTLQVSTFMQCNAMLKKSLHRCLHFRPSYFKKGVYLAMFCFANQAYCDKLPYNTSTNKKCYMYYKDIISHLLIGKNADVISGWSLLAMFFSHWKAYENCTEVINFIVEKCSKNFSPPNCFTDYVRMLQDFFDNGKKLLNKSKSFLFHMNTCIDVLHFDRTSPWFPQELLTNEAKDFDFHRVHPVIFGHFLTFIIALRQTNSFQAEIAVANIVVENRENKIHGYYAEKLSTYIVLVTCYSLLKDKQAADYWRQHVHRYAQKIRKY